MKATARLRQLLRAPGSIVAQCLTAKLIDRQRFPALYMTGAGMPLTRLGQPALGGVPLASVTDTHP
jgi:hypothetical protein